MHKYMQILANIGNQFNNWGRLYRYNENSIKLISNKEKGYYTSYSNLWVDKLKKKQGKKKLNCCHKLTILAQRVTLEVKQNPYARL